MVNRHRGEVEVMLDDKSWTLCLTLGGLCDLEDHFKVNSLQELAEELSNGGLSSKDILAIVEAGFKGGGYEISTQEISEMRAQNSATGYAQIVADLLSATFETDQAAFANQATYPNQNHAQ